MSRAAPAHADLAQWLLAHEIVGATDAPALADATERVFEKLSDRLSRLVSAAGSRALVSRSLYLARAEFPFLEGVRAGTTAERCFEGLTERIQDVETSEAGKGLLAVLVALLHLLIGFIGEDLTVRLVREVWPDIPLFVTSRPGNADGQEAIS
ncbi:MAG: hypothetical protein M3069_18085 [Chloroflexota bacterium]|nr:hypothetical protein [Chloroflexota bacterium]